MLTPTIAVVTNIDREHMDYYHDMDDVRSCFAKFVNSVPVLWLVSVVFGRSKRTGNHPAPRKTKDDLWLERAS
jgi:UDP-N-acetylmuramate-alanine ligase